MSMRNLKRVRRTPSDYTIACLIPMSVESAPMQAMLDEIHDSLPTVRDQNAYVLGSLGQHNVVIAQLPSTGNNDSGVVANQLMNDFPAIRFGLLVGIGGGVPGIGAKNDIRLGDVVVSMPSGTTGGVIQLDRGRQHANARFERTGHLNGPSQYLVATVQQLAAEHMRRENNLTLFISDMLKRFPHMRATYEFPAAAPDQLFLARYEHQGGETCENCASNQRILRLERGSRMSQIHYGTVGSSNLVLRDAIERDRLREEYAILSVEMEAAGVMNTLPCLVIRGICDYADSHKNKRWQPYAAAVAAAYAKELLLAVPTKSEAVPNDASDVASVPRSDDKINNMAVQALINSLAFDRMGARLREIPVSMRNTCSWLFSHKYYQAWMNPRKTKDHHGLLWIKGKPGCGKSTLIKAAYNQIRSLSDENVLHFFFNARAAAELEKSSLGLYRSLVHQLLACFAELRPLFLQHFETKVRNNVVEEWTASELQDFLLAAITYVKGNPLTIFIDALDEGEHEDVRDLVDFLESLASTAIHVMSQVKICLASRHYPHMTIRKCVEVVIEDQPDHEYDIQIYVEEKLLAIDYTGMHDLQKRICTKAHGVFLWVVLVIPLLKKAYDRGRVDEMLKCLDETPAGLSGLYTLLLGRKPEDSRDCFKVLMWVLHAKRPLNPTELYLVMQGDMSSKDVIEDHTPADNISRLYILDNSRGLVEIHTSSTWSYGEREPNKGQTVQFIHESVREFLLGYGLRQLSPDPATFHETDCYNTLKNACLLYITQRFRSIESNVPTELDVSVLPSGVEESTPAERMSRRFPFLEYAQGYMFEYAEDAQRAGSSQEDFLLRFVQTRTSSPFAWLPLPDQSKSTWRRPPGELCKAVLLQSGEDDVRLAWIRARNVFLKLDGSYDADELYTQRDSILYILAELGCTNLVKVLIDSGLSDSLTEAKYGTALQAACAARHVEVIRALIHGGADVNVEGGMMRHAFLAAVMRTSWLQKPNLDATPALVDMLFEAGAKPATGDFFWALSTCIENGRESSVRHLLRLRYPLHDTTCRTPPLSLAMKRRNRELVKLFIDAGASVNVATEHYGNVLQAACKYGWHDIVDLMCRKGVEVNIQSGFYGTALQAASASGWTRVVRTLVSYGADINIQGGYHRNALCAALDSRSLEVIRILLDAGVKLNEQNGVLDAALGSGSPAIIKVLLDAGLDVNAGDCSRGRILQAACASGSEAIVQLLLRYGAEVNAEGGPYKSALYAASYMGHIEIVHLLLEKGACTTVQGVFGGIIKAATAKSSVSLKIRHEIVDLLLKHGAVDDRTTIHLPSLQDHKSNGDGVSDKSEMGT